MFFPHSPAEAVSYRGLSGAEELWPLSSPAKEETFLKHSPRYSPLRDAEPKPFCQQPGCYISVRDRSHDSLTELRRETTNNCPLVLYRVRGESMVQIIVPLPSPPGLHTSWELLHVFYVCSTNAPVPEIKTRGAKGLKFKLCGIEMDRRMQVYMLN